MSVLAPSRSPVAPEKSTIMEDILRVHVCSWNVNKRKPPKDFRCLLSLDDSPDLIAVGLQEVPSSDEPSDPESWAGTLDKTALSTHLRKVGDVYMVGHILKVYAKDSLGETVCLEGRGEAAAGQEDPSGHKGGVWLDVRVSNLRIHFVSAHLTHSEPLLQRRINDFHTVEQKRTASYVSHAKDEDVTIWMGDLNFRLKDEKQLPAEIIHAKLQSGELQSLWQEDELTSLVENETVFSGYKEPSVNFPPTYKYKIGTNTYDLARRPAWTDRVFYRATQGREITPLHYGSLSHLDLSDHKPVEAFFQIRMS